ncbi:MAG: (d)CMP kinase [Verrucomicrobiota bacterium]
MIRHPIAIDGPAASGKTTVAKLVAARLGAFYVSTGELYRAVTLVALEHQIEPAEDPAAVCALLPGLDLHFALNNAGEIEVQLNGQPVAAADLRSHHVADSVSYVARIPEVRSWLVERQRETRKLGAVVAEGRDIGTVVFPETPYKFFVSASPRERARRRFAQAGETPADATLESVAASIAQRDEIDSKRPIAPLQPAPDAEFIMTDHQTAEQVAEYIVRQINRDPATTPTETGQYTT